MLGRATRTLLKTVGVGSTFGAIVLAVSLSALAARTPTQAIAVFAPGTTTAEALAAVDEAGAQVLDYGRVGWIIAVAGRSETLHDDLRQHGAMLLLDPARAAFLCGRPGTET